MGRDQAATVAANEGPRGAGGIVRNPALQRLEKQRKAEEKRRAVEAARQAEERRPAAEAAGLAEAAKAAEAKRRAEETTKAAEEKSKAEETARLAKEKRKAEEAARLGEEQRRADDAARQKAEYAMHEARCGEGADGRRARGPSQKAEEAARLSRRWVVGGLVGTGAGAIGVLAYLASQNNGHDTRANFGSALVASTVRQIERAVPSHNPAATFARLAGHQRLGGAAGAGRDWALRRHQRKRDRPAPALDSAGTFQDGLAARRVGRDKSEGPQRDITLASDSGCSTRRARRRFGTPSWTPMVETSSRPASSGRDGFLRGCQQGFLMRINTLVPGLKLELPSEARSEYAGPRRHDGGDVQWRPGAQTATPTQVRVLNPIAWWSGDGAGETHPVGQKLPNAQGPEGYAGQCEGVVRRHLARRLHGRITNGRLGLARPRPACAEPRHPRWVLERRRGAHARCVSRPHRPRGSR